MTIAGPVENPAANAGQNPVRLCSATSYTGCTADSDCPATETCEDYFGTPAAPKAFALRRVTMQNKLGDLNDDVRALKRRLAELEERSG